EQAPLLVCISLQRRSEHRLPPFRVAQKGQHNTFGIKRMGWWPTTEEDPQVGWQIANWLPIDIILRSGWVSERIASFVAEQAAIVTRGSRDDRQDRAGGTLPSCPIDLFKTARCVELRHAIAIHNIAPPDEGKILVP